MLYGCNLDFTHDFILENDNWLFLRFSGTEPVLRMIAEADLTEKTEDLLN